MSDTQTVRKKLSDYIQKSGHTYREISLKIGRREAYIQQYIKYGLPRRLNEIDRKKICCLLEIDEQELIDDELFQSTNNYNFPQEDGRVKIDIFTPHPKSELYNNNIGCLNIALSEMAHWSKTLPSALRLIKFIGDYMEPTIYDGDMVLFDSVQNKFIGDGLYIIEIEKTAQVKRLQQTENNMCLIKGDNPLYESLQLPWSKVKILGRAIRLIHARPL